MSRASEADKENHSRCQQNPAKGHTASVCRSPEGVDLEAPASRPAHAAVVRALERSEAENAILRRRIVAYQRQQRNGGRQLVRARRTIAILRERLKNFSKISRHLVRSSEVGRARAEKKEEETRSDAELVLERLSGENGSLRGALGRAHKAIYALQQRCNRFPKLLEQRLLKAKSQPLTVRLRKKGVYTAQARMLARMLVRTGCAQDRVGDILRLIGQALGVRVEGKMSSRTVRRAMLELGAAADIQTGFEVLIAKCFTLSGDGTTDRHINMEAQHMLLMLPSPDGTTYEPKNRLLGVESTTDHTSETQFAGWLRRFRQITEAFNHSPYARRTGQSIDMETFALKLKGVGGDHAADQLKTARFFETWKRDMTCLFLARTHLSPDDGPQEEPSMALQRVTKEVTTAAIDASGGLTAWDLLKPDERVAVYASHFQDAALRLGRELYDALPWEEQAPLAVFLRLGCAMHKDLNAVKGGSTAMMSGWAELGLTPPVLLANKDNASTLRDIDPGLLDLDRADLADELSPAELRAFEASTRGGVKLTNLAGALFNHKDDKKGQQDTYLFYFQEIVGHALRFPDTSNTRYQSHCVAAAELLVHLRHYIRFLEILRDRKAKPGFTNMEENIYRGLQCAKTLTELAVLALYAQAVTHPYMRVVRQPKLNGLLLGPFHEQVKEYIKLLIADPNGLLCPDPDRGTGTPALDGLEWERPEAMEAIYRLAPDLPHLRDIFVFFMRGALKIWEQFTKEFVKGGAIDRLSPADLDAIWIMPTNDHNEGILGGRRVWRRDNPNGTEEMFNATKKAQHNETEEFIATHLNTEEDEHHLRQTARQLEAQKPSAARRKEITQHAINTAVQNALDAEEKKRKDDAVMEMLQARTLILDRTKVEAMTKSAMEEQLEVYRKVYKYPVPKKYIIPNRPQKLNALLEAIERHTQAAGSPIT
ncbi:hypothetical protein OH76DRAFT_1486504 [Lentinus brumalis]|uniref:Uncharacterized protein n=1 Tax=Lentinus brumalis TaxID=2498619 RepID=A0A371CY21_9APHY|nr:hypothetical protein OH76DRAFT_1486504 [Polyporus brumalis]